jgi:hypothetical protein
MSLLPFIAFHLFVDHALQKANYVRAPRHDSKNQAKIGFLGFHAEIFSLTHLFMAFHGMTNITKSFK